jgi:Cu(I)/Ag(I) efflux system membrane fusion protein
VKKLESRISFIEPVVQSRSRSIRVRVPLDNGAGSLRPGMFATMNIRVPLSGMHPMEPGAKTPESCCEAEEGEAHHGGGVLAVPKSAVINTGTRTVAFVEKETGVYFLRKVAVGHSAEGYYAVLDGLREGEKVVEKGSFLLDSQSRLTGQAEEVYGGALGKESESHEHSH